MSRLTPEQREQDEAERRRRQPVHVGASTPWKWDESNPLYEDHIRQQNRKRPVPKIKSPQGDVAQEMQNWDALDAAVDNAATDANGLLNVLRDVLDREAALK